MFPLGNLIVFKLVIQALLLAEGCWRVLVRCQGLEYILDNLHVIDFLLTPCANSSLYCIFSKKKIWKNLERKIIIWTCKIIVCFPSWFDLMNFWQINCTRTQPWKSLTHVNVLESIIITNLSVLEQCYWFGICLSKYSNSVLLSASIHISAVFKI